MSNGLYQLARQKFIDSPGFLSVSGATNANPTVVTTTKPHGLTTGDSVWIINVAGNTGVNGVRTVTVTSTTQFSVAVDTSAGGAYTANSGEVLVPTALLKKHGTCIRWGQSGTGDTRDAHDDIKLQLVDTGVYTVDLHQDEFLSSISAPAKIGSASSAFSSKTTSTGSGGTFVGGVADAADVVLSAVTGNPAQALVIYKDTGTAATSPLIAYVDTATGLPVTPNGGDITVSFDNGSNRIFQI